MYLHLAKTGTVYAWGQNEHGELGINNNETSKFAKQVLNEEGTDKLSNIVDITCRNLYKLCNR